MRECKVLICNGVPGKALLQQMEWTLSLGGEQIDAGFHAGGRVPGTD